MRILIISDTHGRIKGLKDLLEKEGPFDYLIHSGDYFSDGKLLAEELGTGFFGVRGNCDRDFEGNDEEIFEIDGKRFFLTHGHKYGVKMTLNRLYYKALEEGADIAVFGHTHVVLEEEVNGLLLLNPGSVHRPRGELGATYMIMDTIAPSVKIKKVHG